MHPKFLIRLKSFQPWIRVQERDSMLEALPNAENLKKSSCLSSNLQFSNATGVLQQGLEVSDFIPSTSIYDNYEDVKVPPVKVLGPFEQSSTDDGINQQSSVEESILQDLEVAIAQFTDKTRICFRDALYRLAGNTKQQHAVQDQNVELNIERTTPQSDHREIRRYEEQKPRESETNSIDRAIANLMFNKMDINVQELPLTTSVHSQQEISGTKPLQGKPSKALNEAHNFHHNHHHHPCALNLQSNAAEVPTFSQTNMQTAADSHVMYEDPTEKSFMLEFG
ncbi:protein LNK1-like isoform X2 [Neltuma alba]|uniref:protein LNK1-like isoform X2 n=1 Tax=Neltuma alba TaxID=207710 RepID=UPI0010A40161|nr:protein LNK1-like isoform X2 [Prosopis alba]